MYRTKEGKETGKTSSRGIPEAILKVAKQSATNLKTTVKESKQSVQAIVNVAVEKAAGRVRAVKESAKESARIALKRAEPGMIKTAQKSDEIVTNVNGIKRGIHLFPFNSYVLPPPSFPLYSFKTNNPQEATFFQNVLLTGHSSTGDLGFFVCIAYP